MKTEQQQIINSLISEFNRIDSMSANNKTFNLINIEPLNEKTNEIERYRAMLEADEKAWEELATQEAYRLIDLLREDLPNACIQKYGKENGYIDIPKIMIRKNKSTICHHEYYILIEINIKRNNKVTDSFGGSWTLGSELSYKYNNNEYKTIQDVVSDKRFLEDLRYKVLS